jgi:heme-degrading monooxygenase HmoA
MYARTTLLEIDTLRVGMADAVAMFELEILPALRAQPGYQGVYVLTTPEGKGLLISFWDTVEQADAGQGAGFYAETLERYVTLFKAPPGRDHYEVAMADLPAITPG